MNGHSTHTHIHTFNQRERREKKEKPALRNDSINSLRSDGLGVVQHPALGPELVSLAFVHQLHCLVRLFLSFPLSLSLSLSFAVLPTHIRTSHRRTETSTSTQLTRALIITHAQKDMIRKNHFAARDDCTARRNRDDDDEEEEEKSDDKHTVHCLDYICQALQCHADTNLEYRVIPSSSSSSSSEKTAEKKKKKKEEAGFTGYGEHQCRDFERVFRFAEEWRVYEGKNESRRVKVSEEEMMMHGRVIDYD